jgi:hypothetical protein
MRRLLVVLLCIEVLLLLASIPRHSPHVDEAWFAEQAFFEARDGYPHSNFFRGFVHEDVRIVVRHWLFITLESAVFRGFGFGLFKMRLLPIVSATLLLALMIVFGRVSGASSSQIVLGLLAFLVAPQAFRSFKLARPEMLATLFGFASFLLLWWDARVPAWRCILGAGACAGAATLTHLNGAIFVATGAAVLAAARRPLQAAAFVLAAGLVFSPYALEALAHPDLFREQINSPLIAYKTRLGILSPLVNLLREHTRLFRKPDIIFLTSAFLVCALSLLRRPRAQDGFLLRYLFVLMVMLGIMVADKGILYSVYLVPFQALVIGEALARWREIAPGRTERILLGGALGLFAGWGLFAQAKDVADKIDIASLNREIGASLPADGWTVVPMDMAFDELERRPLVANLLLVREKHGQPTFADLAGYCDAKGARHAVIYRQEGKLVEFARQPGVADELFEIVRDDPRFLIVKRRPPARE